jgi:alpha-beta hydrolase superfamily lysophospholipase
VPRLPRVHSERVDFAGPRGSTLVGTVDMPAGKPRFHALFAHCFTCGKNFPAAERVATRLAGHGIGVLRFDFGGIGESEGRFAFSSSVDDLVAAAQFLRSRHGGAQLLVGHSLGGAAVLAAAGRLPECRAVATIAAPSDPEHVLHLFAGELLRIRTEGEVEIELAGRPLVVDRAFVEDLRAQDPSRHIAELARPLLVLHSPEDTVVPIAHATRIFAAAAHPRSFVSLSGADHLLRREADARYAADLIAAWASRYTADD